MQRFRNSLRSEFDTKYELPNDDGLKQFEASNMAILSSGFTSKYDSNGVYDHIDDAAVKKASPADEGAYEMPDDAAIRSNTAEDRF